MAAPWLTALLVRGSKVRGGSSTPQAAVEVIDESKVDINSNQAITHPENYKPRFLVSSDTIENECKTKADETSRVCGPKATCVDEQWGYSCRCKEGYLAERDNPHAHCLEVNECLSNPPPCASVGAYCENREPPDLYKCSCLPGYTGDGTMSCTLDTEHPCNDPLKNPCSEFAICKPMAKIQNEYQWTCSCNANFQGNGTHCEEVKADILEAAEAVPETCETTTCTEGSYCDMVRDKPFCLCKPGYFSPSGFGGTCVGIDYCASETLNTCAPPPGGICVDGPGESFVCHCATGYYRPPGSIRGEVCYLINAPSGSPTHSELPSVAPSVSTEPPVPVPQPIIAPTTTSPPIDIISEDELVGLLTSFPNESYFKAFGTDSSLDYPTFRLNALGESSGLYGGMDNQSIPITLNVTEVLLPSDDLAEDLAGDTETTQELIDFVNNQSYTGFVFLGQIIGPNDRVDVVALAYTLDAFDRTYYVVPIYDPLDPDNGISDFNSTEDERRERKLSELDKAMSKPIQYSEVVPSSTAKSRSTVQAQNLPYLENSPSRGSPPQEVSYRGRRLQGCPSGVNDIECPGKKTIDTLCLTLANLAYQELLESAQRVHDDAVEKAEEKYKKKVSKLNKAKARFMRRRTAVCLVVGVLTGPWSFALCMARSLATCALRQAPRRIAYKLALEGAKVVAEEVLNTAKEGACIVYQAAAPVCVECLDDDDGEPEDPEDKPANDSDSDGGSSQYPDPHFSTWNQEHYDFHGACDMIYTRNGLLELHIRTQRFGRWSGVVRAALKLGSDIIDIGEGKIIVNGAEQSPLPEFLDDVYPLETFGSVVRVTLSGAQTIEFSGFKGVISVRMDVHGSDFMNSVGMAGTWTKRGLVGRDGQTLYTNTTEFAIEWEVNPGRGDPTLFNTPAVSACNDPPPPFVPDPTLREIAEEQCAYLDGLPEYDECIFDILATDGDVTWAKNPAYTNPHVITERCVADPSVTAAGCAVRGGTCVYRCDSSSHQCLAGLCVENVDLDAVVDRRRGRRLNVVDGCSCAVPFAIPPTISPTLDSESLNEGLTCISVIDEDNGGPSAILLQNQWEQFRTTYSSRRFCLLQPEPNPKSDLKIPLAFESDANAFYFNVTRDFGDEDLVTDWFDLCGLDGLRNKGFDRVAIFVDNSGSLTTSQVQASYDEFVKQLSAEGLTLVEGIENNDENWISPFLQDF